MKIFRPHFVVLALAAAALSSCERSYYSFQSKTPTYLAVPATPAPLAAPVAQVPAALEDDVDAAPAVLAVVLAAAVPAPVPEGKVALATLPTAALVASAAGSPVAAATRVEKPSFGQRLALRSLVKQATKATARQQNTAGVTHTAATKGSLTVAIIGLVALIVGIIASSGFLIAIGIIALVVGIILYLLKLF